MEQADKERVNRAISVLNKISSDSKKKYSVKQMGVGFKIKNGKMTNQLALIFYVNKKMSKEELASEGITPIPEDVEGIPTDVVEIKGGFKPRNESR